MNTTFQCLSSKAYFSFARSNTLELDVAQTCRSWIRRSTTRELECWPLAHELWLSFPKYANQIGGIGKALQRRAGEKRLGAPTHELQLSFPTSCGLEFGDQIWVNWMRDFNAPRAVCVVF